jgi:hypothetical protein
VILHDQALINAIDRLTGVVSKHFSDRSDQMVDSSGSIQAITSLTTAINHMVSTQDHALSRLIELQQQNNKVMEGILQHKLRKASSVKHNLEAVKHDLEAEEVTASS